MVYIYGLTFLLNLIKYLIGSFISYIHQVCLFSDVGIGSWSSMKLFSSNFARQKLHLPRFVFVALWFFLVGLTFSQSFLWSSLRSHHWNTNFLFVFHWSPTFLNVAPLLTFRSVLDLSFLNRTKSLVLCVNFSLFLSIIVTVWIFLTSWFFKFIILLRFVVPIEGFGSIVFKVVSFNSREPVQKPD